MTEQLPQKAKAVANASIMAAWAESNAQEGTQMLVAAIEQQTQAEFARASLTRQGTGAYYRKLAESLAAMQDQQPA